MTDGFHFHYTLTTETTTMISTLDVSEGVQEIFSITEEFSPQESNTTQFLDNDEKTQIFTKAPEERNLAPAPEQATKLHLNKISEGQRLKSPRDTSSGEQLNHDRKGGTPILKEEGVGSTQLPIRTTTDDESLIKLANSLENEIKMDSALNETVEPDIKGSEGEEVEDVEKHVNINPLFSLTNTGTTPILKMETIGSDSEKESLSTLISVEKLNMSESLHDDPKLETSVIASGKLEGNSTKDMDRQSTIMDKMLMKLKNTLSLIGEKAKWRVFTPLEYIIEKGSLQIKLENSTFVIVIKIPANDLTLNESMSTETVTDSVEALREELSLLNTQIPTDINEELGTERKEQKRQPNKLMQIKSSTDTPQLEIFKTSSPAQNTIHNEKSLADEKIKENAQKDSFSVQTNNALKTGTSLDDALSEAIIKASGINIDETTNNIKDVVVEGTTPVSNDSLDIDALLEKALKLKFDNYVGTTYSPLSMDMKSLPSNTKPLNDLGQFQKPEKKALFDIDKGKVRADHILLRRHSKDSDVNRNSGGNFQKVIAWNAPKKRRAYSRDYGFKGKIKRNLLDVRQLQDAMVPSVVRRQIPAVGFQTESQHVPAAQKHSLSKRNKNIAQQMAKTQKTNSVLMTLRKDP